MHSDKQSLVRLSIFRLAIVLWLLVTSSTVRAASERAVNTISVGGGISFGMFGYSYDRKVSNKVELRLASGIPFFWGGGWPYNIGVRYYIRDDGFWNPRVSLMYGTVVLENFDGDPHSSDPYNNYSLGIGQTFVFNRTGRVSYTVDMDVVYSEFPDAYIADRDSAPADNEITSRDNPLRFALGVGIRY